jgi:NAD(P)H dehydrogenase (quinone)
MKILIVHAHPEPDSFNGALTRQAARALKDAGHEVAVSDLYADSFNPLACRDDFLGSASDERFHYQSEQAHAASGAGFAPELAREQTRLLQAELLILQFPLWWGAPPAIMKGWFDRVLAYGVAYVDGARFGSGFFKGRRALISVTTGGTAARFSSDQVYGDIDQVLWPVRRLVLEYLGFDVEEPFVSYAAPRTSAEDRTRYLAQWRDRVLGAASRPVQIERIDESGAIQTHAAPWRQSL